MAQPWDPSKGSYEDWQRWYDAHYSSEGRPTYQQQYGDRDRRMREGGFLPELTGEETPSIWSSLTPGEEFLGGLLNAANFKEDMLTPKGGGPYATGENSGEPILNPQHPLNNVPPLPPIPGSVQEIPVIPYQDPRHNPFKGQWTIIDGKRVPRTPENTIPGP